MPDKNNSQVPPKMIGTGEGESPLVKKYANSSIRTMNSDEASIRKTGGGLPQGYAPQQAPNNTVKATSIPEKVILPGTPVQQVATPAANPPQYSIPVQSAGERVVTSETKGRGMIGKILVPVIVFLILVVIAVVGYKVIYPAFVDSDAESDDTSVLPRIDTESNVAANEPVNNTASNLPPETNTVVPTSTGSGNDTNPPVVVKKSVFVQPASGVIPVNLAVFDRASVLSAFMMSSVTTPVFEEVVFTVNNGPVTAAVLLTTLYPEIFTEALAQSFSDYGTFVYKDTAGVWPGLVLKKGPKAVAQLEAGLGPQLEAQPSGVMVRLYPVDPGTSQAWAQGKTGTVANRYQIYEKDGQAVSFNYGWSGDYLILSTSYDGFKEVLRHL